jgi:hypothetical protein
MKGNVAPDVSPGYLFDGIDLDCRRPGRRVRVGAER